MMNVREERTEMGPVRRAAGRERERAQGSAVERAQEGNQMCPSGRIASQFYGCLDGFRTGIRQKNFLGRGAGSEPAEFFRKLGHRRIIKIAAAEMQKLARLFFDCPNHLGMRVPRRG